ncbi:hypothetical protein ACWD1Y_41880 [Streptomyces sp. NPDC002814]
MMSRLTISRLMRQMAGTGSVGDRFVLLAAFDERGARGAAPGLGRRRTPAPPRVLRHDAVHPREHAQAGARPPAIPEGA